MPQKKHSWPKIVNRKNRSGEVTSYTVDCGYLSVAGEKKRIRYSFKTRVEAEGKADELRIARRNEGVSAFGMGAADRRDAQDALQMLKPFGKTLREAARFLLDNIDIIREAKTVREVVDELLLAKERDEHSERYRRDLRCRLEVFARDERFSSRPVYDIRPAEIDEWLRSLNGGALNRNNYRRLIGVLFSFAVHQDYALRNPVAEVAQVKVPVVKPGILTADEARALLAAAPADFVPAIALGLFAGLRPESEIWRLDWKKIDLEERIIDVEVSKNTASHRFVRISDNLLAWLQPHSKRAGALTLRDEPYFRRMREARERATLKLEEVGTPADNLRDWPHDCLRHSFASNHYAAYKNAADTAEQLGHGGNLRMFFRHYRNRVKEAEALAFWQIRPTPVAS